MQTNLARHVFVVLFFVELSIPAFSVAQSPAYAKVVAKVGSQEITQGEINSFLKKRFGDREFNSLELAKIRGAALEHLVDRRIIYDFLVEKGYAPGKNQIQLVLQKFEDELKSANQTMPKFLLEKQMTAEHFRFEAAWKLGWRDYLDEKITDQTLESFYNRNRRKFDGTRLQVAQILKKNPQQLEDRDKFLATSITELKELRSQLLKGELNWNDVVTTTSEAPSKTRKGLVGWIEIDGPMPPVFSQAAFQLKTGEISQPVVSRFGIHLIRCIAIEPGKKTFRDASAAVKESLLKQRFNEIVEHQRAGLEIKFMKTP